MSAMATGSIRPSRRTRAPTPRPISPPASTATSRSTSRISSFSTTSSRPPRNRTRPPDPAGRGRERPVIRPKRRKSAAGGSIWSRSGHIFVRLSRRWICVPSGRATGVSNMAFLNTRDSADLEDSVETAVEGEIREFVRRDVATSLRRQPESDSEMVANNITSLLQRVAGTSVQEIDKLISELQTLRDMLQNEGARVQREIVEYATLSQAALQSTKIIAESLTGWKKVPDAPSLRD